MDQDRLDPHEGYGSPPAKQKSTSCAKPSAPVASGRVTGHRVVSGACGLRLRAKFSASWWRWKWPVVSVRAKKSRSRSTSSAFPDIPSRCRKSGNC